MKVKNMRSEKGNDIANQFIIEDEGKVIFQSYSSTIAIVENGKVTLGRDWDYSRTTMKYLNKFIDDNVFGFDYPCNKKIIEKAIKEGNVIYDGDLR